MQNNDFAISEVRKMSISSLLEVTYHLLVSDTLLYLVSCCPSYFFASVKYRGSLLSFSFPFFFSFLYHVHI